MLVSFIIVSMYVTACLPTFLSSNFGCHRTKSDAISFGCLTQCQVGFNLRYAPFDDTGGNRPGQENTLVVRECRSCHTFCTRIPYRREYVGNFLISRFTQFLERFATVRIQYDYHLLPWLSRSNVIIFRKPRWQPRRRTHARKVSTFYFPQ